MKEIKIKDKIINISNPNKVLFPKTGITKGDLIDYYFKISNYILPYLRNRPITLNGFPNGIVKEGFYRQHAPKNFPHWFKIFKLRRIMGGMVDHILCQNKASLIYLINQNIITIHRWLSTITNPEIPDILIVDIDPPKDKFKQACKGAKLLRDKLASKGYSSYVMTTGLIGLHVISKIEESLRFEDIRQLLYSITSSIAQEYPEEFSVNIRKKEHKDLVYFDISRNSYGQTGVCPFSVRATEGAPIATPLFWEELEDINLISNKYKINNIFDRLDSQKIDPWLGLKK